MRMQQIFACKDKVSQYCHNGETQRTMLKLTTFCMGMSPPPWHLYDIHWLLHIAGNSLVSMSSRLWCNESFIWNLLYGLGLQSLNFRRAQMLLWRDDTYLEIQAISIFKIIFFFYLRLAVAKDKVASFLARCQHLNAGTCRSRRMQVQRRSDRLRLRCLNQL